MRQIKGYNNFPENEVKGKLWRYLASLDDIPTMDVAVLEVLVDRVLEFVQSDLVVVQVKENPPLSSHSAEC